MSVLEEMFVTCMMIMLIMLVVFGIASAIIFFAKLVIKILNDTED